MKSLGNMVCLVLLTAAFATGITLMALWYYSIPLYYSAIAPVASFLFLYFLLAFIFQCCPDAQRCLVFLPKARTPPPEFDYGDTAGAGLVGCRNFYLFPKEDEYIGVWHLLPYTLIAAACAQPRINRYWEECLWDSGKHIVIYFHGNTGTRALEHRKELYWLLQNEDFHVIAFDYRGFADSSPIRITEQTTVEDGLTVYNYVRRILGPVSTSKIFIWGHSLGTGISAHTVARLHQENDVPTGLILESPFTNIGEAMKHNRRASIYRFWPFFETLFVRPLHKNGIVYESHIHVQSICIPIIILHSIDDATIPFKLGSKLFQTGVNGRPVEAKPILIKQFPKGHGHKLIHTSPELPNLIRDYTRACMLDEWVSFRA